jgi:hypothetical protein
MSTTITFSGSGELTANIVSSQLTTQTTVIIDGYTSIGANAFEDANTVTSIYIPNTVTSIGESALGPMASLIEINVAIDNSYYASDINNVLFDVTGTTLIQYPIGKPQSSYIIPNFVTSIGDYSFQYTNLSQITFPGSITSIGQYAFQYSNLSQIVIPSGVQTIGIYAFFNNISLTTIAFENNSNLTSIGDYVFASSPGSSSLISINIPASVTSIGDFAFQYSNLSTITFDVNSLLTNIGDYAFGYSNISEIIIPTSILTIGNNAFFLVAPLENVQIDLSSNLIAIGDNTFAGTNITSINIPGSVQTIGNNAFNGLQNIQVYSEYINNLNLIQQIYPIFYGAINANVILYGAPEPPPPAPPYDVNGRGPIQICISRLANCKITKKNNFSNGYVINNRATAIQRISTLISVQSQMRNATWTQVYAPINAYSQRAGGPVGYGQSPKNTF